MCQFDSYFFQANEETLMIRNSTEQISKEKEMIPNFNNLNPNPLLCAVNCSQINQSTGMYCQANIGKFPAYRIFSYIVLTIVFTVHTTYELIMLE